MIARYRIWNHVLRGLILTVPFVAFAQVGTGPGSAVQRLGDVLNRIINWSVGLLLVLAVLFIIYIAFLFLVSGGSAEKVQTAKRYLVYVVAAIALALLSKGIVFITFVLITGEAPPAGSLIN